MLAEVDKMWERPIPMEVPTGADGTDNAPITDINGVTANLMKLKSIIIPPSLLKTPPWKTPLTICAKSPLNWTAR